VTSAESVQRLAAHVRDRMQQLGLRQASVPAAGGPSPATIRGLLAAAAAGKPFKEMQLDTLAKFDRALKWEAGSARDVLAGGEPRPLPEASVIRGRDATGGSYAFVLPPALAAAMADMSEAEREEVKARMVAEAFRAARELSTPAP
jgi:hypothetical protein